MKSLIKGINDWTMAKKKLLEHFQSKDPKQFVDYKILLDTFYRHPTVVIWNTLTNHLDNYNQILIKVEVKDKDIDRKRFWNNLSNFITEKLRLHFNWSDNEWITSSYNEIKDTIQNLISEKLQSMLKETGGQYQLKETRLLIMGVFEGSPQTMIYITTYKSDQIATYLHLQTAFTNPQKMRIKIPISTVTPNTVIKSITITTVLLTMNPQQQISIFDPIERLVNRFEELQLNLLHCHGIRSVVWTFVVMRGN